MKRWGCLTMAWYNQSFRTRHRKTLKEQLEDAKAEIIELRILINDLQTQIETLKQTPPQNLELSSYQVFGQDPFLSLKIERYEELMRERIRFVKPKDVKPSEKDEIIDYLKCLLADQDPLRYKNIILKRVRSRLTYNCSPDGRKEILEYLTAFLVPKDLTPPEKKQPGPKRKIDDATIALVLDYKQAGWTGKDIAKKLSISEASVCDICKGRRQKKR